MKKYIFLVSILTFSIAVQGRSRSGISMEAGAAYYYPFMLNLTPAATATCPTTDFP